jgi:hypothetical protein
MTSRSSLFARLVTVAIAVSAAMSVVAQTPVQFRSDLRVRDQDGKTRLGKLYVGASRLRMEVPAAGGENRATIIDPRTESQFTISAGQRKYMEAQIGDSDGAGPLPRLGTLNPANPCENERLSECKRVGAETVNGYATEKWEYTNNDGDLETAWIATKLRFPIRTGTANGATAEITNVMEGAQPANLFDLPTGYARVDDLDDGDVDPAKVAEAMAMATKMMSGVNPPAPAGPPPAAGANPAASRYAAWEQGAGYVLNVTVTVKSTAKFSGKNAFGGQLESNSVTTARYTASIPLNHGTQAVDVGSAEQSIGPSWSLLNLAGSGSKDVLARPVTYAMDWRKESTEHLNYGCDGVINNGNTTTTTVTTHKAQAATSIGKLSTDVIPQALVRLNGGLTAYHLVIGVSGNAEGDVIKTSSVVDHCAGGRVTNNKETTREEIHPLSFDLAAVPLPATPAAWKGTQTVPWKRDGAETATLEWSIVPVQTKQ